jgi:hypothetical protein
MKGEDERRKEGTKESEERDVEREASNKETVCLHAS